MAYTISLRPTTVMNATLLLMQLAASAASPGEPLEYTALETCTADQQREVLGRVTGCRPRETLVDLRAFAPNSSDVVQVIPEVAPIRRCGGSCSVPSHACIPAPGAIRRRRLEVMLVTTPDPLARRANTECGYVEVEEHETCQCACPVRPEDCRSGDQYSAPGNCRCLCRDHAARHDCLARGMRWDPSSCMCVCPTASWRVCSTGYIFDFTQTCRCVPISTTASMGLMVAMLVLVVCIALTFVGGYLMYRRKTGLFKSARDMSRRNTAPNAVAVLEGGDLGRQKSMEDNGGGEAKRLAT